MVAHGNPKIASYFAAMDAKLADMSDDGDKGQYLQLNADRVAKQQRQLAEDPWSLTASAFDLTEIADGIELRLSRLRESIRAKIDSAESQIPPCHDISDMRAAEVAQTAALTPAEHAAQVALVAEAREARLVSSGPPDSDFTSCAAA